MNSRRPDLDGFFHPGGVALVGRLPRGGSPEQTLTRLRQRYGTDQVHLVNPRGGSYGGQPVHASLRDLPAPVGLAVVDTGPGAVADVLADCGATGVPYALVFTAGFSEVGAVGARLEREILAVARRHGIRLFGPNTNTNAFERMPEVAGLRGGKVGLLTQSGHQGRPIVQGALFGVGFSRWVPTGNEADLELADFLEYFAGDDETAVIAAYVEGFKDVAKLRRGLTAAAEAGKPVVMLKIGSTRAGSRMATSHTGHLTGSDALVDGLFAQYAVTRVRDLDELLDTAALFAKLPAGTGDRLACYSISGGSGTLMAEEAERHGFRLPTLTAQTQQALHEILPHYLTVANPVDNGGEFVVRSPAEQRMRVLELVAADPHVDVVVVGITGALTVMTDTFCADLREFADRSPKPLVVTWNSYKTDEQGFADLVASGLPMFRSFRNCFTALRHHVERTERAARFRLRPRWEAPLPPAAGAALGTPGTLTPEATRTLLAAYDVPLVVETVAADPDAAARAAVEIGAPVVCKVASAGFPHKSDAGLVRTGLAGPEQARAAAAAILERARTLDPSARVDGVCVQPHLAEGTEMIAGVISDPGLGPGVLVGTGGVFAEVLADVAVRPLPVDAEDVREMVAGLRGYPLLVGARGRPKADVDAFVEVVLALARLAQAAGGRLAELDCNPVLVGPDGATVLDALVVAAAPGTPAHPGP